MFFFLDWLVMEILRVIIVINMGYEEVYGVMSLNDIEVWVCGNECFIKLYNI